MTRCLAAALLITFSLAACRQEAAPPAPVVAPAPPAASAEPAAAPAAEPKAGAALSIPAVALGTSVGADNKIGAPLTSFAPSDTIIVAIDVGNAGATPENGTVTARWLGPDGQVFNEESQQMDFAGDSTINFRVAEPKGFNPGSYKLEVALNGSTVQAREFKIK